MSYRFTTVAMVRDAQDKFAANETGFLKLPMGVVADAQDTLENVKRHIEQTEAMGKKASDADYEARNDLEDLFSDDSVFSLAYTQDSPGAVFTVEHDEDTDNIVLWVTRTPTDPESGFIAVYDDIYEAFAAGMMLHAKPSPRTLRRLGIPSHVVVRGVEYQKGGVTYHDVEMTDPGDFNASLVSRSGVRGGQKQYADTAARCFHDMAARTFGAIPDCIDLPRGRGIYSALGVTVVHDEVEYR